MTTLEIILSVMVYVLFAILSYKPFKRISDNNWTDNPKAQCMVAPFMWIGLFILAVIEGFKYIYFHNAYNNKNEHSTII